MAIWRIFANGRTAPRTVTTQELERIKTLEWLDPGHAEALKALTHDRKLCPALREYGRRKGLKKSA